MNLAVLLATYNGEKYLEQQLQSLLCQSYSNIKIYISDDCSTDATKKIINHYVDLYPEKIIDLKNSIHFGNAKDNFLNLVEKVEADLFMFCDQDDVWLDKKIEKTLQVYSDEVDKSIPILVHSDLKVVDSNLKVLHNSFFDYMKLKKNKSDIKSYMVQNYVTGCTMLINKELADLYKKNTHLINKKNILMHDYFFALLASLYGKILFCDEQLMLYRQHGNNSVGAKNVHSLKYIVKKINEIKKGKSISKLAQKQVGELLNIEKSVQYIDNNEVVKLLEDFSSLYKSNKFKRLSFIVRNRLLKDGFARKIYQVLAV